MADRPVEQLTLREMFTDAERMTRELIEHLDQGFIPKANELGRAIRPIEDDPDRSTNIEDVTIRNYAVRLLESEDFTDQLYDKIAEYCVGIDASVSRIVTGS